MLRTSGKVVNLRKINKTGFLKLNKIIYLICLIFLIGLIFSVILFSKGSNPINFKSVFNSFYLKREGQSFFITFLKSFSVLFSVIVVYFLFGASVMGVVTVPMFTMFLGYFIGGISAYIYSAYGLKGIAFNALLIIPPAILFCIGCFFAAKTSVEFSSKLSRLTVVRGTPVNLFNYFKEFCGKYIVFSVLIIISAVIDTTLSVLFIKLFDL